jgi:SHS2 domain-containing protein
LPYEILDHTADVEIRFYGSSIQELLASFTEAWANLTLFSLKDSSVHIYAGEIPFENYTDMLYRFASLFIEQLEVDNFYINELRSASISSSGTLSYELGGFLFSEVSGYSNIPKAPTYHQIFFDPEKGYGQIIFDL